MKSFCMFVAGLFLAVSMAACAYVGASPEYPSAKIRYKMTVEVETPEGIKAGAAVREISMRSRPMLMGESNDTRVDLEKGEAVVVDLGPRGVLFSTLGAAGEAAWTFMNAFPSPCAEGKVSRCSIKYYRSLGVGTKAELAVRYYPFFVTFGDLKDHKSAKRLLEMKSCPDPETGIPDNSRCVEKDHFEALFGQGVRLKSVMVEVTQEPISSLVDKWIPWLETPARVPQSLGAVTKNPFTNVMDPRISPGSLKK